MVWFYHDRAVYAYPYPVDFQSHYGLILSPLLSLYFANPHTHPFNPTMVWFYRSNRPSGIYFHSTFQSHYGLILSQFWSTQFWSTSDSFNPTMVWFYLIPLSSGLLWTSISLSIPLWSDFILPLQILEYETLICFQSHYGLILSRITQIVCIWESNLSIPLWSDFIRRATGQCDGCASNFQSHYGLILSHSF